MAPSLPPFAPFPVATWRDQITTPEWITYLHAWASLAEGHLSLSDQEFTNVSLEDDSIPVFLCLFVKEIANHGHVILGGGAKPLMKVIYLLTSRLQQTASGPVTLLQWGFLSDFSRAYGRKRTFTLISQIPPNQWAITETSLSALKKALIKDLDRGLSGDLKLVEERLSRLNFLIRASPSIAHFLLAGSDFVDGLISCFKIMNPPLRSVIIATTYLCLVGLVEIENPKISMLTDQLYSLKAAADIHKSGPLNVNDSLVAELVTTTPAIQQLQRRLEVSGSQTTRTKSVLQDLNAFRKPGGAMRPKRLIKRRIDKGKSAAKGRGNETVQNEMHIHRMSQITQVQDLFPDLGAGFVSKVLDEYADDTEQVVAHLLEGSLPPHLEAADRSETLSSGDASHQHFDLAPSATPPLQPQARRNIFDDDDLDRLAVDTSQLHFGKKNQGKTADDMLQDRSKVPKKAAILSALAAFDSDDDERDDTYDAEDVGGTVDAAVVEDDAKEANDEVLFRTYQTSPQLFERDVSTRRGAERARLKAETGMTDEAIEGWALMLARNPQQRRRLEAKFSVFDGRQNELTSTSWRADPDGSEAENSGPDAGGRGGNRGRGRGRGGHGGGRGGRGGRGGGNVAGPTGDEKTEQARKHKESNKGSRANHNRRNQRAKKMARGGFPG